MVQTEYFDGVDREEQGVRAQCKGPAFLRAQFTLKREGGPAATALPAYPSLLE